MLSVLNHVITILQESKADTKGVTALEYGLIASLVAIAIVGAVTTFASNLSGEFSYIAQEV